ncbi:unnamed protein product [Blepharisma stoltei]|uniref:Uncharacterized protein n=1 Tax=Blepharisma stoltei TaxID=1481888 RepID=A0AAU9K8H8_9CILI|nr:unnamed protein product [Blepharisma stoltei]
MEPAISLPIPMTAALDATSPASPPELPPVDLVGSHGLTAVPYILFVVSNHIANCIEFPLTNGSAPCLLNCRTKILSYGSFLSSLQATPVVDWQPSWNSSSLIDIGTPFNSPSGKFKVLLDASSKTSSAVKFRRLPISRALSI